jgi:hypothetical protein
VQRLLDDLQTAMAMPRVHIVVSRGSPAEDKILLELARLHPRYRIVDERPWA